MSLVVVGAVKASEILPKIQAAFGGLRATPAPDRAHAAEPAVDEPRTQTLERVGTPRGYLMMGFRGPGMDTKEDVCAMDVLLYVLGEQRGQSGRLNRELRQRRGLVSSIYSDYVTLREPGVISFWAETRPEQLDTVRDAVLEQLALVRDTPVPDDEIRRAKALLLGVYTLDNETYDGQAGTLGFYEAKDTYRFALDYEDKVLKVTAADVQRVAQKYFGAKSYCLVDIKPKAAPDVPATNVLLTTPPASLGSTPAPSAPVAAPAPSSPAAPAAPTGSAAEPGAAAQPVEAPAPGDAAKPEEQKAPGDAAEPEEQKAPGEAGSPAEGSAPTGSESAPAEAH
jgi:hypothetical protein